MDTVIAYHCGLSHDDLIDQTWKDWYQSGMDAREAAYRALEAEGLPFPDNDDNQLDPRVPQDFAENELGIKADDEPKAQLNNLAGQPTGPITDMPDPAPRSNPEPEQTIGTCQIAGSYIKVPVGNRELMLHILDVQALLAHQQELQDFATTFTA